MSDDLEAMLGIDMTDPRERHARELVDACYRLVDALAIHRSAQGITRAQVAEHMGIGEESVEDLERHLGTDMRLSTLRRYAFAIGATVTFDVTPWRDPS